MRVSTSSRFAVSSVSLLADGVKVGEATAAPYAFSWTSTAADAGRTVSLTAVVTDSSGQTTTTAPLTLSVSPSEVVVPVAPTVRLSITDRNTKKGTAAVRALVNTASTLSLSGKGVKAATATAATPGAFELPLKVKGAKRRALVTKGKVTVKVLVTVTAAGGTATATKSLTLFKKKK